MNKFIDEGELADLINEHKVNYVNICPEFIQNYEQAKKDHALEVLVIPLEICSGLIFQTIVSVKSGGRSPKGKYGLHAGYVLSPEVLKGEIIQELFHGGWVLSKVYDDRIYG